MCAWLDPTSVMCDRTMFQMGVKARHGTCRPWNRSKAACFDGSVTVLLYSRFTNVIALRALPDSTA